MTISRFVLGALLAVTIGGHEQPLMGAELPGDRMLAEYFREETAAVNAGTFADIHSKEDWTRARETYREQLQEMLGLSPLPPRTDLKAVVTGQVEEAEFLVEKLHFQSMPGLYVGANLYLPKKRNGRLPAILYVCGHGGVEIEGVNYGNKTTYQHHGAWFARHGYVCLTIDTIQLGELAGLHHGTYRDGKWWWNARGYTPAGVEAWNSMRALDYLQSRPEVDGDKLGMTGRSGGGAYTWWTAALDERVKVAVPVAGITDLRNHVVDGCVSGHCDCMYMVNTYRWDYAKMAAMLAPRPLLIANSDKDRIFPLDGVVRLHADVAKIYNLYGAADKLGLLITEGPHKDTQDLQVPTFRWFNRFLKGEEPLIAAPATKFFTPQQLKVFTTLPADERTTKIHDTFVAAAAPVVPSSESAWREQRQDWLKTLREKSFAGWPKTAAAPQPKQVSQQTKGAMTLTQWDFTSQDAVKLPLMVFSRGDPRKAKQVRLFVLDEQGWNDLASNLGDDWQSTLSKSAPIPGLTQEPPSDYAKLHAQVLKGEVAVAYLPPRGVGPTAWSGDEKQRTQIRRRYMLLGQTLDGMRVWDIQRAVAALRTPEVFGSQPIHVTGERHQAVNALYASLFAEGVASVDLVSPPASHNTGPDYLNVMRFLDVPQAVVMAAERSPVKIVGPQTNDWAWTSQAVERLGWSRERVQWAPR